MLTCSADGCIIKWKGGVIVETKDVLKQLRERKNYSIKDVANGTGMQYTMCREYESGDRKLGMSAAIKFANFYQVSLDYLLCRPTAKPPADPVDALIASKDFDEIEEILLKKYLELPHDARMAVIQFMREVTEEAEKRKAQAAERREKPKLFLFRRHATNKASAGTGHDLNNDDNWTTLKVVDCPEAHEADFTVEVDGDSMEPAYKNGSVVYITLDPNVPLGKVGLFRMGEKGYIKRRGKDRLISDNPEYDDIYPEEEIECIGRVIGTAEVIE